MIVFPLIRSVGLKAATASSRAATLPMFVRTRPSRARLTISVQLRAIGYDDEENRPAVSGPRLGRAGDGHQRSSGSNYARGPLRDVAAEDIENRIELRRPLARTSLSRSTNSCAPKSRAVWRPAARPVPMTYAPASRASWLAIEPTTPAAPCTRTRCPGLKAAVLEQPLPRGQARASRGPRPP